MNFHRPLYKNYCLYSDLSLSSDLILPVGSVCDLLPFKDSLLWLFSSIELPRCEVTFCLPPRLRPRSLLLSLLSRFDFPLDII